MRWEPEINEHGAYRFQQRFALFPTILEDGTTVWLEKYWVKQCWFQKTRFSDRANDWISTGGEWRDVYKVLEKEE